jgi:hypothetical protein
MSYTVDHQRSCKSAVQCKWYKQCEGSDTEEVPSRHADLKSHKINTYVDYLKISSNGDKTLRSDIHFFGNVE